MLLQEALTVFGRAIQNYSHIVVAGRPGIFQKWARRFLVARSKNVAEPIQSGTKRSAPFLVPVSVTSGVAPAVAAPSLDSVCAAPRTVFEDLHFVRGRMFGQKLTVICDLRKAICLNMLQRVRKGHFAKVVVVPITFTVGGNMQNLRPISFIRKAADEAIGESFAIVEQSFEGNSARDRPVIEEQCDSSTRWQLQ